MKKFAFGCLGFICLLGVGIGAVFFFTADLSKSADQFLLLINQNKIAEAYQSTAKDFKATTSFEQFQAFITKNSLNQYESSFWNSRSIKNNLGKLTGTLTTKVEKDVPFQIDFIKEQDLWKVLYLGSPKSEIENNDQLVTQKQPLPNDQETTELVKGTMALFIQALTLKDFSIFYENISAVWKTQLTIAQLTDVFKVFFDKKNDISNIIGIEPVLSEKPSIDEDGILNVKGYYPFQNGKVTFEVGYLYEYPNWKLAAIDVHAEPLK